MENETKNPENPPAFPMSTIDGYAYDGMTLRDYFANSAMQGFIAQVIKQKPTQVNLGEYISTIAYSIADEMLKEREKPC